MSLNMLPVLVSDSYKQFHQPMYPANMTKLYSNMTPRKSRFTDNNAVWFGLQYDIKEYLIKQWNELFFERPLAEVITEYKRFHKYFSGREIATEHIEKLHKLGYLPLRIKALPEGVQVPMKVPFYTITNTHPDHAWLVNFLETQMSTTIWDPTTVATISYAYRRLFAKWAFKTTGNGDFASVQWQAHDFSMRGRSSIETSINQLGHLLSFTGTDVIPAVIAAEHYYNANMEHELIAGSVPATEHSVMTSYGRESEIEAFERILHLFADGIVSIVADSYDLFSAVQKCREQLYNLIMGRNGKLVFRPDSGDPVKIITGYTDDEIKIDEDGTIWATRLTGGMFNDRDHVISAAERKGMVELLWDLFGGTTNELGYKLLDSHVGVIYGDSITLDRAGEICELLADKGFASTNWVAGIGSFTFNYNTRDSLGIAVKSTYCEISNPVVKKEVITDEDDNIIAIECTTEDGEVATIDITPDMTEEEILNLTTDEISLLEEREIFKDPITDDGTKKSAKGLLRVDLVDGVYVLRDQVTAEEEEGGELKVVFEDGKLIVDQSLAEIRARVESSINAYMKTL